MEDLYSTRMTSVKLFLSDIQILNHDQVVLRVFHSDTVQHANHTFPNLSNDV